MGDGYSTQTKLLGNGREVYRVRDDWEGVNLFEVRSYKHQYHCEDGPAVIHYDPGTRIVELKYYRYGRRHRKGGPAFIKLLLPHLKYKSYFHKNGSFHRELCPDESTVTYTEWWENGVKLSDEFVRRKTILYIFTHIGVVI
jgi:hypothetical protein